MSKTRSYWLGIQQSTSQQADQQSKQKAQTVANALEFLMAAANITNELAPLCDVHRQGTSIQSYKERIMHHFFSLGNSDKHFEHPH